MFKHALHAVVVGGLLLAGAHRAAAAPTRWNEVDQHWSSTCAELNTEFKTQATCTPIDHKSFDSKEGTAATGDYCVNDLLRLTGTTAARKCAADDKCRATVAAKLKTISCRLESIKKRAVTQTDSALTLLEPALEGDGMDQEALNIGAYVFVLDPDFFWAKQEPFRPEHTHDVCKNNATIDFDRASIRIEDLVNSANVDAKYYCTDFVIELQKLCSYHQAPKAEALTSIVCGEAKPGKPQSATLSGTTLRFEFSIYKGNIVPSDKPGSAHEVVDKAFGQ